MQKKQNAEAIAIAKRRVKIKKGNKNVHNGNGRVGNFANSIYFAIKLNLWF